MPYVSPQEALNFRQQDLGRLRQELGPPPWRQALVGTSHTRWVLLCWPPEYATISHWHPHAEEVFHVLAGQARFRFGPQGVAGVEDHLAGPGTLLLAQRGVEHTIAVAGDEPFILLCSVTPNEDVPDETIEVGTSGPGAPRPSRQRD